MKDYWARKIVAKTYNMMVYNGTTTILIHSERQSKFLHLQQQCYWDCGYCYEEAMATLKCVVCQKKIDWELVLEVFEDIFTTADTHGVDALTEHEQMVYERRCCSEECYEKLS